MERPCHSDHNTLTPSHPHTLTELRAVTERSDMDGDDDVQGLEVDDHELNIDRGFIRALNSSQGLPDFARTPLAI